MRKKLFVPLLLLLAFGATNLAGCQNDNGNVGGSSTLAPDVSSTATTPKEDTSKQSASNSSSDSDAFSGVLRLHYHGLSHDASEKSIYIWAPNISGLQFEWTGTDDFGGYYDMDCNAEPWKGKINKTISIIIKNHNSWSGQSSDTQISVVKFTKNTEDNGDGRRRGNVYLAEGNGNSIDVFTTAEEALQDNFRSVKANVDWRSFDIVATAAPATEVKLYKFDADYYTLSEPQQKARQENYLFKTFPKPDSSVFKLDIGETINPHCDYMFSTNFDSSKPKLIKARFATMQNLYDTSKFISEYTYSGNDLGMKYFEDHIEFRLWAPTVCFAQVIIYGSPNGADDASDYYPGSDAKKKVVTLARQRYGVYAGAVGGNFEGMGYVFRIYQEGNEIETIDPYVRATGVNGTRGAIIDFSKTNPEGWDHFSLPQQRFEQLSVYEVHVRDFTADETWVSNEGNKRGTYKAFIESGTTYQGVKTGFDSILELGPNAVQLLPVADQDNEERVLVETDEDGNEVLVPPGYNWGYNPQNFNVVEGAYASNPYDPVARIVEYKELIQKFAEHDIGVIMDVVYNHVGSLSASPLNKIVPQYYFYYQNDAPYDQTGCGNSINSSRIMTERFIVDSITWWAKEYNVKGFRFDLMGCLETDTMRALKNALHLIDPTIVVYGEGWAGMGDKQARSSSDTYNVYAKLGNNGLGQVGCFNDCVRDGLKGNTTSNYPTTQGVFINSPTPSNDAVWDSETMFIGQNRAQTSFHPTPANQSVNFVACHDNYTLYDQVNYQLHGAFDSSQWIVDHDDSAEACLALNSAVVFSQGLAFLHGGDEFFRQKIMDSSDPEFDYMKKAGDDGFRATDDKWVMRNSYRYGDDVNAFKWDRKVTYKAQFDKLAAAIKYRNSHLGTLFGKIGAAVDTDYGCLTSGIGAGNPAIGAWTQDSSGRVYVCLSGNATTGHITLPAGTYDVLYSTSSERGNTVECASGGFNLARFEALVLKAR